MPDKRPRDSDSHPTQTRSLPNALADTALGLLARLLVWAFTELWSSRTSVEGLLKRYGKLGFSERQRKRLQPAVAHAVQGLADATIPKGSKREPLAAAGIVVRPPDMAPETSLCTFPADGPGPVFISAAATSLDNLETSLDAAILELKERHGEALDALTKAHMLLPRPLDVWVAFPSLIITTSVERNALFRRASTRVAQTFPRAQLRCELYLAADLASLGLQQQRCSTPADSPAAEYAAQRTNTYFDLKDGMVLGDNPPHPTEDVPHNLIEQRLAVLNDTLPKYWRSIVLHGRAGAGKTPLLRSLAAQLADRGALVIYAAQPAVLQAIATLDSLTPKQRALALARALSPAYQVDTAGGHAPFQDALSAYLADNEEQTIIVLDDYGLVQDASIGIDTYIKRDSQHRIVVAGRKPPRWLKRHAAFVHEVRLWNRFESVAIVAKWLGNDRFVDVNALFDTHWQSNQDSYSAYLLRLIASYFDELDVPADELARRALAARVAGVNDAARGAIGPTPLDQTTVIHQFVDVLASEMSDATCRQRLRELVEGVRPTDLVTILGILSWRTRFRPLRGGRAVFSADDILSWFPGFSEATARGLLRAGLEAHVFKGPSPTGWVSWADQFVADGCAALWLRDTLTLIRQNTEAVNPGLAAEMLSALVDAESLDIVPLVLGEEWVRPILVEICQHRPDLATLVPRLLPDFFLSRVKQAGRTLHLCETLLDASINLPEAQLPPVARAIHHVASSSADSVEWYAQCVARAAEGGAFSALAAVSHESCEGVLDLTKEPAFRRAVFRAAAHCWQLSAWQKLEATTAHFLITVPDCALETLGIFGAWARRWGPGETLNNLGTRVLAPDPLVYDVLLGAALKVVSSCENVESSAVLRCARRTSALMRDGGLFQFRHASWYARALTKGIWQIEGEWSLFGDGTVLAPLVCQTNSIAEVLIALSNIGLRPLKSTDAPRSATIILSEGELIGDGFVLGNAQHAQREYMVWRENAVRQLFAGDVVASNADVRATRVLWRPVIEIPE